MIFIYSHPMGIGQQYTRWLCFCLSVKEQHTIEEVREYHRVTYLDEILETVEETIHEGYTTKGKAS